MDESLKKKGTYLELLEAKVISPVRLDLNVYYFSNLLLLYPYSQEESFGSECRRKEAFCECFTPSQGDNPS